jgi:uncharacterized protein (TIRG00374 family)
VQPTSTASVQTPFFRKHGGKLIASAVITASIVYTLKKGGLKFIPEGGNFSQVRWWTIPLYLATLVVTSYFRAVRWRYLLRSFAEIPRRRLLAVSWIGFAAILIMPFRIGEFVRPYMIREKGKVSMSAATGTIVAERIVDGLYLSLVLAIALILVPHLEPLPDTVVGIKVPVEQVRNAGFLMLGVFTVAFTVIAFYYWARDFARRATLAVFGIVSKRLGEKLAGMAEHLADGLSFLGRGSDALPFLAETTAYWTFNALGMWLLAWGCGVTHGGGSPITFGEACALMGMLGITILIPGPPGLLGVFQLGIYAGMTMYFPTEVVTSQGAAYVFLLYATQVLWTILGAMIFLVGPGSRGNLRALEEAEGILPAPESAGPESLASNGASARRPKSSVGLASDA